MNDPYILLNGTLKNILNIESDTKLDRIEAALTADRLVEIEIKGPSGPFDYDRLKATHKYIFQDIYEWAGRTRTISISKGNSQFTTSYLIGPEMEDLNFISKRMSAID